jgi:transposase
LKINARLSHTFVQRDNWSNTHRRFSRWATRGVWEKLLTLLAADADNEYAMIDATIVRANQHSAGPQKKPAKTKR